MFRKTEESSPDREGYSSNILREIPGEKPEHNDNKVFQDKEKLQPEQQQFQAAIAGFTITEPSYDFKALESPCTVTSASSLVPVCDEKLESAPKPETSHHANFSISSVESVIKFQLADVTSSDKQITASSSSHPPPEHRRQLRKKRKTFTSEECPVCGVTVRVQDIQEHYKSELKKLNFLKRKAKKPAGTISFINKKLQQVKANRARRSRSRGSKVMKDVAVSTCLVCHPELLNDESAVHTRALLHLTECVGVGEDLLEEAFQEYSPEDERIVSYVDHVDSLSYNRIENAEDEDSPVIVDSDDDDIVFGSPQFSEQNLIPCGSTSSDSDQSALSETVVSISDEDALPPLEVPPASIRSVAVAMLASFNLYEGSETDETDNRRLPENNQPNLAAQISALKSRIKDLEDQLESKSASKCNICLEHYKNPLVSVGCWHVSCEECWMKTLGAKKLCPQCAKITLPTNLRRIYL